MTIRGPVFTIKLVWPKPRDWAWPNIVLLNAAQSSVKPVVRGVADERRPLQLTRSRDYPIPNIVLLNAAQLRVAPVGKALDETVPKQKQRVYDFPIPNLLLIQPVAAPPTFVFRAPLYFWPKPAVHPIDGPLPNLAALAAMNVPAGARLGDLRPAPQVRQRDVLPANLLVIQPVAGGPFANWIFDRPPLRVRQFDFQFTNVAVLAAAQLQVAPVGEALDETVPAVVRHRDFIFPNLLSIQPVVAAVPFASRLFERPPVAVRQQDFLAPNLLAIQPAVAPTNFVFRDPLYVWPTPVVRHRDYIVPNLAVNLPPGPKPFSTLLFDDRPRVRQRVVDVRHPDTVLRPSGFVDLDEEQLTDSNGNLLFETDGTPLTIPKPFYLRDIWFDRPVPAQRVIDTPLPNSLITTLSTVAPTKPSFNSAGLFDRPVRVSVPRDGPLPNLLTTTLSVVGAKPFSVPLFSDRPAPRQRVADAALPNILVTVLATVPGTPIVVRWFGDRPLRTFICWDTLYPNLVVHTKGHPQPPITDTTILQLPINAVMIGNQPLKVAATAIEANAADSHMRVTVATEGPRRLSEKPSTFTTKTDNKGYD